MPDPTSPPASHSANHSADDDAISARIRAARVSRGMTQQDLAVAVGVSRSAVAQWETARAGQVRGNLTRIAACLRVSVGHLLHGDTLAETATADDATELALLRLYRECDADDRAFLLRTAIRLARKQT
jgi:transcriptional regulator with XRE-family HTH domain